VTAYVITISAVFLLFGQLMVLLDRKLGSRG
jgi:hypothetical protein